jgi:hypothetical protein
MAVYRIVAAVVGLCLVALPEAGRAETLRVPGAFASIRSALEAARDGDEIAVEPGIYVEDIDFAGKAVRVVGAGRDTVIQGTGTGPVVTFASGEPRSAILDSVVVTGGRAPEGGGIRIAGASPTVVRTFVVANRAETAGSGVLVTGPAAPLLYNNVVGWNRREGPGDPHSLEVRDAAPILVNNTIVRGDSNGVIFRGVSAAVLRSNVIARNGSVVSGELRGRGICDFSGQRAEIRWNVFHANRVGALLRGGRDWRRVERLQRALADLALVAGNVDGAPGFRRPLPRRMDGADLGATRLRRGAARDAGDPDPTCADRDGSRNDAGHTGGPFAAPSTGLPDLGSCGAAG